MAAGVRRPGRGAALVDDDVAVALHRQVGPGVARRVRRPERGAARIQHEVAVVLHRQVGPMFDDQGAVLPAHSTKLRSPCMTAQLPAVPAVFEDDKLDLLAFRQISRFVENETAVLHVGLRGVHRVQDCSFPVESSKITDITAVFGLVCVAGRRRWPSGGGFPSSGCGVLGRGFGLLQCTDPERRDELLAALSCKGRGWSRRAAGVRPVRGALRVTSRGHRPRAFTRGAARPRARPRAPSACCAPSRASGAACPWRRPCA